jgi:hypothetical protein
MQKQIGTLPQEDQDPGWPQLRARARAIRTEYAQRLISGDRPEHQELYEKIADLSLQLEHRLPPGEASEALKLLKGSIRQFESLSH